MGSSKPIHYDDPVPSNFEISPEVKLKFRLEDKVKKLFIYGNDQEAAIIWFVCLIGDLEGDEYYFVPTKVDNHFISNITTAEKIALRCNYDKKSISNDAVQILDEVNIDGKNVKDLIQAVQQLKDFNSIYDLLKETLENLGASSKWYYR
ncbi:unnamed protein product [Blepharisma stoltei]|uniref:Uncharacterized protein n=1 Tax=Blepharisma stoltei TaxID=1481888 RepID=A0AAU9IWT8_9CILI|nr:unnamed protein product [Blepharisma stoltei]